MTEDAGAAPPPDASTTPAGDEEGRHSERLALLEALAHMTPVRCSNHGNFGGGSGVQTDSAGAGECRVVGGDGAAAMHTPSASVVKGYIRARRRTPQTSLGPAKRVPIADAARDSLVGPRVSASVRAGDVDSLRAEPPAVRCGDIGGSPVVDRHSCLPVSASSPKHSCGGERDVADLWALTEGLRRSAQMALHASSSSGSGGSGHRSPATPAIGGGAGPEGTSPQQSSPPVVPARRLSFVPVQ